jgi:hypothetical protein
MIEKIKAPVSVSLIFNHKTRSTYPSSLRWDGKTYKINKIGMHHTYRTGRTLIHVFSVESDTLFFRIVLNTESLHWSLEEIADGLPN